MRERISYSPVFSSLKMALLINHWRRLIGASPNPRSPGFFFLSCIRDKIWKTSYRGISPHLLKRMIRCVPYIMFEFGIHRPACAWKQHQPACQTCLYILRVAFTKREREYSEREDLPGALFAPANVANGGTG
jgi:hypothetical protein